MLRVFLDNDMTASDAESPPRSRARGCAIALGLVSFVAVVIGFCDSNFRRDAKHLDFRAFYAAGQMVADGDGSRLYDHQAQREYQRRAIPDLEREVYPFPYMAAAAVLYVPFTWMSLRAAYDAWCVLSAVLLAGSLELLRRTILPRTQLQWLLPFSFVYVPVGAAFVNGQTSILMLAIYTVSFALLLQKRDLAAGAVLGLAVIKFNFVLPFILVAALARKFGLIAGFAIGATLLFGVSVAVVGFQFPILYGRFLTAYAIPTGITTVWPQGMPNLRGLLFLVLGREAPLPILAVASVPMLWLATRAWQNAANGFAAALLAALLMSYHANLHDLVLLLIPVFVMARTVAWRSPLGISLLLILLPPMLALLLLSGTVALAAIPMSALLLVMPRGPQSMVPK
jgi:hypothetical protein